MADHDTETTTPLRILLRLHREYLREETDPERIEAAKRLNALPIFHTFGGSYWIDLNGRVIATAGCERDPEFHHRG
jgi:hypothetical protein